MTDTDESGLDRVQKTDWIAEILARVEFVAWDRFTVSEMDGYQFVDVYGWIERDDDYKDFVWSRFWPETETVEYTTSSDEYTEEIQRIWFGEESMEEHSPCRRVENTFDVENAVELDEPELVTDGGRDAAEAATDRESHHARYCESCGQLIASTEKIRENVEEPVHRVEILRAVGDFDEVGETTAVEEGECDDCGGQVVKRYYAYPASAFEEPDFEPDEDEFAGRDPDEDALMALTSDSGPEDYEEVREMSWIKGGNANGA